MCPESSIRAKTTQFLQDYADYLICNDALLTGNREVNAVTPSKQVNVVFVKYIWFR